MRERAETFGGRVEVWSQVGAGTEVALTIAASIAYRLSSAPFNSGRPERRVKSVSNNPKPIQLLVVDDHLLLREGIAAIIVNQTDIELVSEASNGREAMERFRSTVRMSH
jgi:PleD family two-component response regulator